MKLHLSFLLSLALTLINSNAFAQPIPASQIAADIHTMARLLEEKYVDAAKGKQIAAHLQQQHRLGYFKSVKDQRTFDSLLTQTLRAYSRDGHLFVKSDPAIVQNVQAEAADTAHPEPDIYFYGPEAAATNFGFTELKIRDSNIGYLKLSEINISGKSLPVLQAAMAFVAHTRALIIDLRGNGGGGSDTGAVLESYFLPAATDLLEIKSREGKLTVLRTVPWLQAPRYDRPVYLLVNSRTASAAEAFAFVLQAHKRAVIVGQATAGACNMNTYFAVNDNRYISISTEAPVLPGTTLSWEQKGIQPDHIVPAEQALDWAVQHFLKTNE